MGHGFGELAVIRRIIMISLSPFEQRAFAGFFKKGFPNQMRKIREEIFYVAPPFIMGWLCYDQTEKLHARMERKNPKDYEDEV